MNKPDWNTAPDWAIAWAVDASGQSYFYSKIPYSIRHCWSVDNGECQYAASERPILDWVKSLELRPGLFDEPEASDAVNNPSHYTQGGVECIDALDASMTHEAFCGHLKATVIAYLWRYEKKENPVQDLQKASWYLDRLIEKESSK